MAEVDLPEEIILLILCFLPVKSLIRFACVSKRFRFIILSDPKFAKSQFQAACDRKTLTRRLLYTTDAPLVESLDLKTAWFGGPFSVRKLMKFHFQPPDVKVRLLGSVNGLVFLVFNAFDDEKVFYLWNPSTDFYKKMPDPGFSRNQHRLLVYGVGYLPATDDYKVFVVLDDKDHAAIFSSRANAWKTLHLVDASSIRPYDKGTFLKGALHWLDRQGELVAFDLAQEEDHKLRKMQPPNFQNEGGGRRYRFCHGVSARLCLFLARFSLRPASDCIDVWVMGEYDVPESWTKLCNLRFSYPAKDNRWFRKIARAAEMLVGRRRRSRLALTLFKEEDECSVTIMQLEGYLLDKVAYVESLLRMDN